MAVSGLKRDLRKGLAVVFFAGGLFAASGVFPGEADSLPVATDADNVPRPAVISVANYAATSSRDDPDSQSQSNPDNASRENDASQTDATDGQTMLASYYGRALEGNPTASGEPFDADAYTAAHKSLPLGTELRVSHGGESVRVTVNDRGPYVAGRDLDLSLAAAQEVGLTRSGTAPVRVVVLS